MSVLPSPSEGLGQNESRILIIHRSDVLELESGNLGGETGDNGDHLPWPEGEPARSYGAAFGYPIVLGQTSHWIWRRPYVESLMADGGPQEIAAIEGRYRPNLHIEINCYPVTLVDRYDCR